MLPVPQIVYLVLYWTFIIVGVFALIDAVRRHPDAFAAISDKSKNFWLVILGGGLAAQVLFPALSSLLGILGLAGIVAALVYIVGVRPKLIEITRR